MERERLVRVITDQIGAYVASTQAAGMEAMSDQELMNAFSTFYLNVKVLEKGGA